MKHRFDGSPIRDESSEQDAFAVLPDERTLVEIAEQDAHEQAAEFCAVEQADGVMCFCGSPMQLRPSRFGRFWGCTRWPDCDGSVGAHPDGSPLGIAADRPTKTARIEAHAAFDNLYKRGPMTRSEAYAWLASRLGLTADECHIALFDEAQCRRVLEVVLQRQLSGAA